jgi:hypothetical protein
MAKRKRAKGQTMISIKIECLCYFILFFVILITSCMRSYQIIFHSSLSVKSYARQLNILNISILQQLLVLLIGRLKL